MLADDVLVAARPAIACARRRRCRRAGDGRCTALAARSRGLSVIVDARILSPPMTGTQVHVLELIAALARTGQCRVSAIVPDRIDEAAARSLDVAAAASSSCATPMRPDWRARADVVHRPFQIDNPGELSFLTSLGDRLVITQQDLIGYHNPSYFASRDAWEGYRELTRTALAVADRVLFFSAHARARRSTRSSSSPIAPAWSRSASTTGSPVRRRSARRAASRGSQPDAEVMLCLGNDYRHKNRLFALRMLDELITPASAGTGRLVLAGPHVPHGSSAADERRMLSTRPELAAAVVDLGAVSEAEKAWLLGRAGLVLYPTVHEGFGLVPFEAAEHGVPCMWAAGTSLSELLPTMARRDRAVGSARPAPTARSSCCATTARANATSRRSAGRRAPDLGRDRRALLEVYERRAMSRRPPAGELFSRAPA